MNLRIPGKKLSFSLYSYRDRVKDKKDFLIFWIQNLPALIKKKW
jgi:ribosomal protein L20